MKVCVFVGPSIPVEQARSELDAEYFPPAAQGDVFRATHMHPNVIAIIDGYFGSVPSIWHKEVLWAMKEGIHVYGSSSMGALRAAELEPFGMIGVGEIFAAFRDRSIEDDDEVAVLHASPEQQYRPLSEAMVNIRFTLAEAVRQRIIAPLISDQLITLAKGWYYPDRTWKRLLEVARGTLEIARELRTLEQWLPANRVDQKRCDALVLLRRLRTEASEFQNAKQVRFHFEHTCYWDQLWTTSANASGGSALPANCAELNDLNEEVCLNRHGSRRARTGALARRLAIREFENRGLELSPELIEEVALEFRRQRGLKSPTDLEGWMERNKLTRTDFLRLVEDEARVRWADRVFSADINLMLADYLRSTGEYEPLVRRASEKRTSLAQHDLDRHGLTAFNVTEEEVLRWFFERRLQTGLPNDLEAASRELGFSDAIDFRRSLVREWHFCQISAEANAALGQPDQGASCPLPPSLITPRESHFDQGDIAPEFALCDASGNSVSLNEILGRPSLLVFSPPDDADAVHRLHSALGDGSQVQFITLQRHLSDVSNDSGKAVNVLSLIDPDRVVHRRYGFADSGAVLLDSAGRIRRRFETVAKGWPNRMALAVRDLVRAEEARVAPLLIIDDVLDRTLCNEVITRWQTGGNRQVGVLRGYGSSARDVLDTRVKRRRDHILQASDPLSVRIQALLARRVYPELARLFAFIPRSQERLRIACYQSADQGFFRAHRDNRKAATSTRRFSVSINLNAGGFEGGHIWFPEFGRKTYCPDKGAALLFPSSLLHEVCPVTRGDRFALITFLRDR